MNVEQLAELQLAVKHLRQPVPKYISSVLAKPASELLKLKDKSIEHSGVEVERDRFQRYPEETYWRDPQFPEERSQIRRGIRGRDWGALSRARIENLRSNLGGTHVRYSVRWGRKWDANFYLDPKRGRLVHWESYTFPPGYPVYWMGSHPEVPQIWESEFPSFLPMFRERHDMTLLNNYSEEALTLLRSCLESCRNPDQEILTMLAQSDWRPQFVAALALLHQGANEPSLNALWKVFDEDSWVAPQVCLVLAVLDSQANEKMKKRLLLGPEDRRSYRCWSTLCWFMALTEEGREWLLARFTLEELLSRVLSFTKKGLEGPDNANDWYQVLREIRPEFDPGPPLDAYRPARALARLWVTPGRLAKLSCPRATVEALTLDIDTHDILEPLVRPGLDKGDRLFQLTRDAMVSQRAEVALEPGLGGIIAEYLLGHPTFRADRTPHRLPALKITRKGPILHLKVRPRKKLKGHISLSRDLLQNAGTEAICYGAIDSGEMGGGVAMAVYQSCGPEVLTAVREGLVETSREVGEVVFTPAFQHPSADIVCHIIATKGERCPKPEMVGDGVYWALRRLDCQRVLSVAFSNLATGGERAAPKRIAAIMLGAVRRFFNEEPETTMQVVFCLPAREDFLAFEAAMVSVR